MSPTIPVSLQKAHLLHLLSITGCTNPRRFTDQRNFPDSDHSNIGLENIRQPHSTCNWQLLCIKLQLNAVESFQKRYSTSIRKASFRNGLSRLQFLFLLVAKNGSRDLYSKGAVASGRHRRSFVRAEISAPFRGPCALDDIKAEGSIGADHSEPRLVKPFPSQDGEQMALYSCQKVNCAHILKLYNVLESYCLKNKHFAG